jgi:hypothetical protein
MLEHLKEIDPYGEENWEEKKKKIEHIGTTLTNACPVCGGDVYDGTGTGWLFCKNCNLMW